MSIYVFVLRQKYVCIHHAFAPFPFCLYPPPPFSLFLLYLFFRLSSRHLAFGTGQPGHVGTVQHFVRALRLSPLPILLHGRRH